MKTLLLCLSLFLLMPSCGTHPSSKHSVLRLNLADDPDSLDPCYARSLKDLTLVRQLFDGLMRFDQQGICQPALAESYEISEDLTTYTFHLREAYWSNHDLVTADDFAYAFKRILDPNSASDYSYMLYPLKNGKLAREGKCPVERIGVHAVDERTLVIELETPFPYFLELLAFPTYYPINSRVKGETFVCNGPFALKRWIPQESLTLEKNTTYWDNQAVHLTEISFSILANNNTESHLFEKGELDWLGQPISHSISTEILHKLKNEGKLDSYAVAGTFWLNFNTEKEPFDDPNIRKAFAYAINRQEIITHILQGNQLPATSPLPPMMMLHDAPYFADGDVAAAQTLFKQACAEKGWDPLSLPPVELYYAPRERNAKIVQLVQQQWQKAFGISVALVAMEPQLYRQHVRQGDYQIGVADWIADFKDPIAFLELFKFKNESALGHGMNDSGWENPTFISLLDQSTTENDPEKRSSLLEQAETLLMEEMPIAPVYHYAFDYVKKPYVEDVILSPLGIADFKSARLLQ